MTAVALRPSDVWRPGRESVPGGTGRNTGLLLLLLLPVTLFDDIGAKTAVNGALVGSWVPPCALSSVGAREERMVPTGVTGPLLTEGGVTGGEEGVNPTGGNILVATEGGVTGAGGEGIDPTGGNVPVATEGGLNGAGGEEIDPTGGKVPVATEGGITGVGVGGETKLVGRATGVAVVRRTFVTKRSAVAVSGRERNQLPNVCPVKKTFPFGSIAKAPTPSSSVVPICFKESRLPVPTLTCAIKISSLPMLVVPAINAPLWTVPVNQTSCPSGVTAQATPVTFPEMDPPN